MTGLQEDTDAKGELEELLDVMARLPADIGDQLRDCGAATPPFDGRPIQFQTVWPLTPDKKADLFPAHLDAEAPAGLYGYQPDPATPEFPLALISPASERTISSTLAELSRPEVRLLMHPDDAAARALKEGDSIRVFNGLGEVRCNVTLGALDPSGHGLAAQRALAEAHGQWLHGQRARAGHAQRSWRRGLFQRRARAGGAAWLSRLQTPARAL